MATSRSSTIWNDKIKYGFWLVFDEQGNVNMYRSEPSIKAGQRSMYCSTTLPRSLFKLTSLKAEITVAEGAPAAINLNVKAAAEDALFDAAQELQSLRVRYKMATGDDA